MPDWKEEIRQRLESLRLAPTREAEIVEELSQHLEDRYEESLACGATKEEAWRAVLEEWNESELLTRELRRVERPAAKEVPVLGAGRMNLVADIWQDLRYAARSLRRHSVLSVTVLCTLTLGIGLNTAVFTLINADTLRPHVEKDPDSFLRVHAAYTKEPTHPGYPGKVTLDDYLAFAGNARSCDLSAVAQFDAQLGQGDPARVRALLVTSNFFFVYGLERPLLGRLLQPADYSAASPVVVLSEELWRNRFGADPQILGKVIHFNDQPLTIVGVTPTPFAGRISRANAWLPYTLQPYLQPDENLLKSGDADWLTVVGRLKRGSRALMPPRNWR